MQQVHYKTVLPKKHYYYCIWSCEFFDL